VTTPSFSALLRQAIDARLVDVHTSLPGRVVTYDSATQRATVQPLLKRGRRGEDGQRVARSLPIIPDVPVAFLHSAGGGLTVPVAAGDPGWLVFAEGALDTWLAGGDREVDPGDDRRFALTDAVFYPGARSAPIGALAAAEGAVVLSGDDVRLGDTTATSPVATKATLDAFMTILGAVVDPSGACAALHLALTTATWPAVAVATKVKAK
jgi:hypothetical protein